MIERYGNQVEMVCDSTGKAFSPTYNFEDFGVMVEDAKAAGWTIKRVRGEWRHFHPSAFSVENEFDAVD